MTAGLADGVKYHLCVAPCKLQCTTDEEAGHAPVFIRCALIVRVMSTSSVLTQELLNVSDQRNNCCAKVGKRWRIGSAGFATVNPVAISPGELMGLFISVH